MRSFLHWVAGIACLVGLTILGWTSHLAGIMLLGFGIVFWVLTEESVIRHLRSAPNHGAVPLLEIAAACCGIVFVVGATVRHQDRKAPARLSSPDQPYVFGETAQFIDDDSKVRLFVHNSGKTPALDLTLTFRYLIASAAFDLNKIRPSELSVPTGEGNAAAGQILISDVSSHKIDHPEIFGQAKRGLRPMYVFGMLQYGDIQGYSHETRFCFKWSTVDSAFMNCPPNAFVEAQQP